jgi:hypothetical protein
MSAEPINFIVTSMAQELIRAARALIHMFFNQFEVVNSAKKYLVGFAALLLNLS